MTAFFQLGNLVLTLPLASAIAAWLLAARDWRAAGYWLLLFAGALAIVGTSKVAFLGWGTEIPALRFQAFSGHAASATTVFPVLLYLLLQRWPPPAALVGAGGGFALGAALAIVLVATGEHTAAEACAGWIVGALASGTMIRIVRTARQPSLLAGTAAALAAFIAVGWVMQQAQVGYWMVKVALALSGNRTPFSWDSCG
ncbi:MULTISPECIES: phosphoesterase [unclassified Massilia]|uniref:phosphoesterase n=1 Tax=unclassified Massilia TaxID=2609279 RepID=UPI00177AE21A|nr:MULTISPECIES: phosphoesterase [unclassified Massilia]MBD8531140.1 phosphoesterase [Massilia sp. CFBP 13647]MBD8674976.1 phosphoesterase [Massilia sp. CFBP 13721]